MTAIQAAKPDPTLPMPAPANGPRRVSGVHPNSLKALKEKHWSKMRKLQPKPGDLIMGLPLLEKADFPKQDGSEIEQLRWINANLWARDPDKASCPGMQAFGRMMLCRVDKDALERFYQDLAKLVPAKTQAEAGNPYENDGKGIDELLVRLQQRMVQGGAETGVAEY